MEHGPQFDIAFTNAHVVGYFVSRTADDGLPAGDFKSINASASRCGHVQQIQVCRDETSAVCVRAKCLPEMRKDSIYLLEMTLIGSSYDVFSARCGYAAGMGPKASCKHIAALCYANFRDFVSYQIFSHARINCSPGISHALASYKSSQLSPSVIESMN